jgi:hypothetical protein
MLQSGLLIKAFTLEACLGTSGMDAYMQREASILATGNDV